MFGIEYYRSVNENDCITRGGNFHSFADAPPEMHGHRHIPVFPKYYLDMMHYKTKLELIC